MTLLGTILLWLLWVLLGLLALVLVLVLLALLLPAQVKISYTPAGVRLWVGALGLRMQILPPKKKIAPARTQKKKEPPAAKQPPTAQTDPTAPEKKPAAGKKKMDVQTLLGSLPALVDMAGGFIRAVLRSLHFGKLILVVPVSGGAPDVVARNVGRANAWFYAIASALENGLRLGWQRVNIFPDYDGSQKDALLLEVVVTGQLLPIAVAALWLLASLRREKIL